MHSGARPSGRFSVNEPTRLEFSESCGRSDSEAASRACVKNTQSRYPPRSRRRPRPRNPLQNRAGGRERGGGRTETRVFHTGSKRRAPLPTTWVCALDYPSDHPTRIDWGVAFARLRICGRALAKRCAIGHKRGVQVTLRENLLEQIRTSGLMEDERQVAEMIIGNIDDYGYLQSNVDEHQNQRVHLFWLPD